eukprot:TRINITY_DN1929_c0_g1_i3.p1 TRINITY_DN1929_c0_g1~~TRINITY_DN1929_c0_g1_i3.p1  ORF type:complete len:412 (-),score=27.50 TRINITY_DN1929_c0_g1_i3:89-1324(-)
MITCRRLLTQLSKRRTVPQFCHRFYAATGNTSDPFELLGITRSASKKDIKKAFIKKAKLFHPDLNKSPEAERKFVELRMAYETVLHSIHIHSTYTEQTTGSETYTSSTSTYRETRRSEGSGQTKQSTFAEEYYDVSKPHPEASRYTMRMAYTVPVTPSEGWRERNAKYYMYHWEKLQEEQMEERDMESVIDEMFSRLPLQKPDIAKLYRERFEVVTFGRKITPDGSYYPMVFEAEQYIPANSDNPRVGLLLDVFMHSRPLSSVTYVRHNELVYYKGSEIKYYGKISDYKMEIKDIDGNLINIVYLTGKGVKKFFSIRDAADSVTLANAKENFSFGLRDLTFWTPSDEFMGSAGRTLIPAVHVFNPYHEQAEFRWAYFIKDTYLHKPVDPAQPSSCPKQRWVRPSIQQSLQR